MARSGLSVPKSRKGQVEVVLGLVCVVLLGVFPAVRETLGASTYMLVFLYFVFFWITQATSWNIFSGYAGYLNFGQNAFYGIGVYCTALLVEHWNVPLLVILPFAAAVGCLASLLAGLIVFRLRTLEGEIFALFTLALGLGLGLIASNVSAFGGGQGIVLPDISYPSWLGSINEMLYTLALVLAVISVVIARSIQRSRMGFGLAGIRDDESVARTLGVPAFRYKLAAFGIGGALSAASGALQAVLISFITPAAAFGPEVPMFVILMSFIGGRRRWMGPVIGALLVIVVVSLRSGIADQLMARWRLAVVAAAIPAIVIVATGGASDVISLLLWTMLGALALLLVPDPIYNRYLIRRRDAPRTDPDVLHPAEADDQTLTVPSAKDGA
jgi:branched-chain amino acid transport system permease protein